MMAMEYFCCYHSYARKLAKLSDQEVGRLFRALLKYSETGEAQELTGRESVAYYFIADDIDRAKEEHEEKCRKNRENAKKRALANADERHQPQANTSEGEQRGSPPSSPLPPSPTPLSPIPPIIPPSPKGEAKTLPPGGGGKACVRKARGEYGWVKLSDEEFNRLTADLGADELYRCIKYIDESAQSSGNKNHWKDWNLVIRRCSREGWGKSGNKKTNQMQPGQSVQPTPDRIKKSSDWLDAFLAEQEGGKQ